MIWRLVGWLVLGLLHRRVALAGDLDRRRAEAALREGYADGYLTLDEFTRRTGRVLSARSRRQLQGALAGLSLVPLAKPVRSTVRDVVLVVVTGAYVVFSLVLALIVALALLLGASTSAFVAIAVVWLIPTHLFVRFRRRH